MPPSCKSNQEKSMFRRILIAVALLIAPLCPLMAAEPVPPYIFTDGRARLATPGVEGAVPCHVATITAEGFGPRRTLTLTAADGAVSVSPLCEGIHVVSMGAPVNQEQRFLAIAPPPPLDAAAVRKALPRTGAKLLEGQPFLLLSMGDSVTATGDYEAMLAMLLSRATGNTNITLVDKSYPGRSIDATVRHFDRDTRAIKPDLGLLMYGLNDQAGNVPLPAYLEQYAWVADQLAVRFQADTVFLQPTPHIAVFGADKSGNVEPPQTAFRTAGFAEAVARLGERRGVPVARTFAAVWGAGTGTIPEAAMALWPLYPTGYASPFSSLLESRGKGDTIHPNALGHLQIAKAVFAALNGQANEQPMTITGQSRWTDNGVVSRVTATNRSDKPREGRLEVYPPSGARIAIPGPVPYSLAPGESVSFEVAWPEVRKPEDLLRFPYFQYLCEDLNPISVVDVSGAGSTVRSIAAPFEVPGEFVAERQTVEGRRVSVTLNTPGGVQTVPVKIPKGSQVGRVPLIRKLESDGKIGYAVAEVAYVQYAQALNGEAKVDGDLREWDGHRWAPVGEPCQARGRGGPLDNRKSPDEAYIHMAFKAGANGLFIALRGRGELAGDRATLFFDPRAPEELGTVGPYYWAGLSFAPDGAVHLGKGETSVAAPGMNGRWRANEGGLDAELFIPYVLMDRDAWPASGDLGFSLVWTHQPKDGQPTQLMWSEDGHEWNPRWYGVLRCGANSQDVLPFRVRVR
jgi:lysophospholipase L1-like esterase